LTDEFRNEYGGNENIDKCSDAYKYGKYAGDIAGMIVGGRLAKSIMNKAGWGIKKDPSQKNMGPHIHYGPFRPNSQHPKWHFGPYNPNYGRENFTWSGWFNGGRPWRWK
jgi:hypothetical protein